jgi:hypothetical protein
LEERSTNHTDTLELNAVSAVRLGATDHKSNVGGSIGKIRKLRPLFPSNLAVEARNKYKSYDVMSRTKNPVTEMEQADERFEVPARNSVFRVIHNLPGSRLHRRAKHSCNAKELRNSGFWNGGIRLPARSMEVLIKDCQMPGRRN